MRLPFRNHLATSLTIFIEPWCEEYKVPARGEAIVTLEDGYPHSIDIHPDQWISIWLEGPSSAVVDIVSEEEKSIDEALRLVHVWLSRLDAPSAFAAIEESINKLEGSEGYVRARARVFMAFHNGFRTKEAEASPTGAALPAWSGSRVLAAPYVAGGRAAHLNNVARSNDSFPGLGIGPFDTDKVRSSFDRAVMVISGLENLDTR